MNGEPGSFVSQPKKPKANHSAIKKHCKVCKVEFKSSRSFHEHLRCIHGVERPYVCQVCRKCFPYASSLYNHLKIHSPDRPFICKFCGSTFRWKFSLKCHLHCAHFKITQTGYDECAPPDLKLEMGSCLTSMRLRPTGPTKAHFRLKSQAACTRGDGTHFRSGLYSGVVCWKAPSESVVEPLCSVKDAKATERACNPPYCASVDKSPSASRSSRSNEGVRSTVLSIKPVLNGKVQAFYSKNGPMENGALAKMSDYKLETDI